MVAKLRYCFVFVCQQGELELKSLLLAVSLKHYLRCDFELVAALPSPDAVWGRPSAATLSLLAELGVRLVAIENPIGVDYPIGNKLACLNIETSADKIVFLDSDILCLQEFRHEERFDKPFNAKPADFATFTADSAQWRRCYAAMGLSLPSERITATVSGQLMPPYFNAGVITVLRTAGLGEAWIEAARTIDADEGVANKRPWLDQIALPVALAALGLPVDYLDERFNYPAHVKPLNNTELPYFCHYHSPAVLRREPLAAALVVELAERHPALGTMIREQKEWASLLEPYATGSGTLTPTLARQAGEGAEVVITGIPRSGTSYLCAQLNRVLDCVVINEPVEIFQPLAQQAMPWGVPLYYRDLRSRILRGEPIENKLKNGEFIEDTALVDGLEHYRPKATRPDFLLATKNTLAYLARLPHLRRVMPNAPIIACIRHPLDTIASWKSTFPHLKNAAVESLPVGNVDDPFLTEHQRQRLREIAASDDEALRRALLWRYLAEILLDNRDRIVLIRYEEMVADPGAALAKILRNVAGASSLRIPRDIQASSPRIKREVLTDADYQAIGGVCGQVAAELGYGEG